MFRQAVGPSLEGLRAQNEVRTTLLQGLGGAILLVGAYVTYRQLQTSREGQITERFTRAIDQLGSEHLDVRLGGIYALERIARDSPADRATIGEVLTAFVRTHAPWPPSLPNQPAATAPIDQVSKLQVRAPDVQASLWVLGRGGFARALGQDQWLDLSAVDLRRADLRDAHLGDVDFRFAGLQKAYSAALISRGPSWTAATWSGRISVAPISIAQTSMGPTWRGQWLTSAHAGRTGLTGAAAVGSGPRCRPAGR
jgi:hypothetical protein